MDDKDQKTEEPTAHKRQEARKDGNVFQSQDIAMCVMLFGMFLMLRLWLPRIYIYIRSFFVFSIEMAGSGADIDKPVLYRFLRAFLFSSLPLLIAAIVFAILSHGIQTRFNLSFKPLSPKFDRLNPISGFKRIFSLKRLVETLKNILKLLVLGFCLFFAVKGSMLSIARMSGIRPENSMAYLLRLMWNTVLRVLMFFLVIAVFDFLYERKEYHDNLKMTKQEVKDEYKMLEGNQETKNRMKSLHRQMSNRRMMQDVPKADVIVRNPTHFAVALKYDPEKKGAPYVVAKGMDNVAMRIIDIASQHGVPWVEDRPLARALYASVDIGQEIPREHFKAVAEIIVYIYKREGKEL